MPQLFVLQNSLNRLPQPRPFVDGAEIPLFGRPFVMRHRPDARGTVWIEGGEIAYPVQEITIAGNLKQMLQGIAAVGADAYTYGAKTTGSVLIDRMKVAGA